jgi:hypothetical protein
LKKYLISYELPGPSFKLSISGDIILALLSSRGVNENTFGEPIDTREMLVARANLTTSLVSPFNKPTGFLLSLFVCTPSS